MKEKYHLLREVREDECDDGEPVQPRPTIRSIPLIYGLVPITSNVVLLAIVCFLFPYRRFSDPSVQLYSPVNRLIEYEVQTVVGGFAYVPVRTEYMGASNNTDRLWEDLYNSGVSLIPKEEAEKLPQSTESINGYPDQYLVILSLFHELHCLNRIRKTLYPEVYGELIHPDGTKDPARMGHLEHCVDLLRQTLMCKADTSVGFFRRGDEGQLLPQADIQRTCRKFDKLRDWAVEHHANVSVS